MQKTKWIYQLGGWRLQSQPGEWRRASQTKVRVAIPEDVVDCFLCGRKSCSSWLISTWRSKVPEPSKVLDQQKSPVKQVKMIEHSKTQCYQAGMQTERMKPMLACHEASDIYQQCRWSFGNEFTTINTTTTRATTNMRKYSTASSETTTSGRVRRCPQKECLYRS